MRRIAKLASHVLCSNFGELPYPYRVTFAVTNRCQARCAMCGIWTKPPEGELSREEIDTFFSRSNRFSWINLTGGEIFLRDDIRDIFRSIARHCRGLYLLNFPTNGFETDAIVAAVREILQTTPVPRLMVTVSLDGPRELHDRIRGLPGSWERAVATFRRLRELTSRRFSVCLGYTLQEANVGAYDDTVEAARREVGELSPAEIHVNVAHVSGHYYANDAFPGLSDPAEAAEVLGRIAAQRPWSFHPVAFLERRYQRLAQTYLHGGSLPLVCQAAAASLFIDPAGTVYPCSGFGAPLGSLRDHDYDLGRLWRTERRKEVRALVRNGACPGCWTPCEAYQTILANLTKGWRSAP